MDAQDTKHTPGPWSAQGCSVFSQEPQSSCVCTSMPGLPEGEANARLIAAAPALLAACEAGLRLADQCNEVGGETAWQKMFRAALAQAKGGAQ